MRPRISCRWRRGVVPTAILSGPIHILRKRDGERAVGGRGGRKWFPPGMGERQNMLLARQEAARGSRRTVPVAFGSCCANAGMSSLVSLFPVRRRRFSFKVRLRGLYFEDSERSGIVEISNTKDDTKSELNKLLSSLYML